MNKKRCSWVNVDNQLSVAYHDNEWGKPCFDDNKLFEMLVLESAQAGLSWQTILNKRENYRLAFDNFNPEKIACYTDSDIEKLLQNTGIVRNKLKIKSAINNANIFLQIQKEYGSFSNYLWQFVDFQPIQNHHEDYTQAPITTPISDKISKDLKKRGMKFIGSTIIYAYMQAIGMVNDHQTDCFKSS
ncbi:MAG: DNA-3-methyladenine glycosylase I [Gammaproteobacteria bacterium]|nr:DNA-3-methyladenine glycosylase I [Gammaproteobacteria bacterium]